jgi:exonuclease III
MIKIITLNINGIKDNSKQQFLNKFLNQHRPDILSLQETNINNFTALHIEYLAIINNNVENKRSGTIIIHKKEIEIIKIEKEESGRITRAQFKNFIIVNIYAPTQNETAANRHLFFLHTLPKFLKANDENTIILGDFNSIVDPKDREGTKKKINHQLKNVIDRLKFVDAFRMMNPDANSYTFISPNGKSRIDRIYVPSNQKDNIRNCTNVSFVYSDHVAVLLELEGSFDKPVKGEILWKLNTSILHNPDFQEQIESFIVKAKSNIHDYQFLVDWWEKEIKEKFKIFSQSYCKIKKKETNIMKKFYDKCLDQVKTEIDRGGKNLDDYYFFKNKLKEMHKVEEEGKQIRGKLNHSVNNEVSTVANLIKEKTNGENRIIKRLESNATHNPEIHEIIHDFYKELYTLKTHDKEQRATILENIDPILTNEMNQQLVKEISENEVFTAINTLQDGKSPGIDGLPIEFYKKIWPYLKQEITNMYNIILNSENLSKTQSTGIITLLHKGGSRDVLGNWRPISLLCSDYKILAKILTLRLKTILPKLISDEQTGGIQNRDITQNLITYRNIIEHFSTQEHYEKKRGKEFLHRNKTRGAAIVSLDFEKAYDMLDRTFLYEVLQKFGFDGSFINFIKILYETSTSKIFINKAFGEEFQLQRGVRQGCPMAMYLYIIFIEPFLKLIKKQIQPIIISQASHQISAFVDDVAIFIENPADLTRLEKSIEVFEKATNSRINKAKSHILKLGQTDEKQWPTTWLSSAKSVKMLGIHWHQNILTTIDQNCNALVVKIQQSIQNTFNRLLTIQQKVTYFNTFIIPKLSHFAKILPVPKEYSDKIQQIGHSFIWRHTIESIAKSELYHSISEGGLNLIHAKTKYKSLFLKTILHDLTGKYPTENSKVLKYWIGLRLRKIFPVMPGPNSETPPSFLMHSIELIKNMATKKILTQDITTKEIYMTLILQEQKIPKIILKSPNTNFKPGFKAMTKQFLSPFLKEHMFLQIHNVLPTKDRLIKCKQDINPKCENCSEIEDLKHLFCCKLTMPAVKIVQRKIFKIYKENFTPTAKQIYLFDFPANPPKSQNKAIFLAANLSLIVWKKRKKPNFIYHFINSLKKYENEIRKHQDFEKWF